MRNTEREGNTHLSKDGMGAGSRSVEPVQKGVVSNVDKELGSSAFGLAGVGHGKGSRFVADSLVGLTDLVGDSTAAVASVGLAVTTLEGGVGVGTTGSSTRRERVLGIRTSKL